MRRAGVTIGIHYPPTHLFPIAERFRTPLPVTEEVWKRVATLPLFPTMTAEEQELIVGAALAYFGG